MKATILKTLGAVLVLFFLQSFTVKGIEGTWIYEAPNAPPGYEKGEIIIEKNKDGYALEIHSELETIEGENVKLEKNTISFEIEVEGGYIDASFEIEDDKLTGVVESPDGDIEVTAKRKKGK